MANDNLHAIKTVISEETYKDIKLDMEKQPFKINLSQWLRWVIDKHLYQN